MRTHWATTRQSSQESTTPSGGWQWMKVAGFALAVFAVPVRGRAQNEPMPDVAAVTMRVRQAHPEYVSNRAELNAAVAAFNARATAFNAACKGIDPDDAARLNNCRAQLSALQAERAGLLAPVKAFNATVQQAMATAPYKPSSNGTVGGKGRVAGYN